MLNKASLELIIELLICKNSLREDKMVTLSLEMYFCSLLEVFPGFKNMVVKQNYSSAIL